MGIPLATYRLQFCPAFGFRDAEAIVPYLRDLGISHIYASPILTSRRGSTHGYDVTDPTRMDPELGSEGDFQSFLRAMLEAGLGLVLDIVPNHMAADVQNPWWHDVLAHGRASPYADYFDIDWPGGNGKVVLPVLGSPLEDALAAGEIGVAPDGGSWAIAYFDRRWPIAPESVPIARSVKDLEGVQRLLEAQHYVLAHWRTTPPNYRRFFDIIDLVGTRSEREEVFAATHALPLQLLSQGTVDGLRIDHVDGLRDPLAYLKRLRQATGPGTYIVVEKILGPGERLPEAWPVHGTSGYDFLAALNGLFVDEAGLARLGRAYADFTGVRHDFDSEAREQKRRMLQTVFSGETAALGRMLASVLEQDLHVVAPSLEVLSRLLIDITAQLPVYRTYADAAGMPSDGKALLDAAVAAVVRDLPQEESRVLRAIRRVLLLEYPADVSADRRSFWLDAVMRWQQLSGPATAKGVEDTAFYRYNRLISLNEVGGNAEPTTPQALHRFLQERARAWPHTMNATSTHDTKRSEDVRARLHVLSWMPEEWETLVKRWRAWNQRWKREVNGSLAPDANTEWMLYQILVGVWPLDGRVHDLLPRLETYLTKAMREAKEHTSWLDVNDEYESTVLTFARAVLDDRRNRLFVSSLRGLVSLIAPLGTVASLAQLAVKATSPGVPDFYQGQELWDFSLTDPDNRRPVDFDVRRRYLREIDEGADVAGLPSEWRSDRLKLYVTRRLMALRRHEPELFMQGSYEALATQGGDELFAYGRHLGDKWLIVTVPRALRARPRAGRLPSGAALAGNAVVVLPESAPSRWTDVLTGHRRVARNRRLNGKTLLNAFPLSVLSSERAPLAV